jgi:hypothetical protein
VGEKTEANLRAGAAQFLHPNEQVVATLIAAVRGRQQAMAGGIAGMVGGGRAKRARRDAEEAGINLAGVMAFVLTPSRLVMLETGNGGKVKRLLNEYELRDVGPMEVKRLGLGASVTLMIEGAPVKLESRVGASREFADHLERAKSG